MLGVSDILITFISVYTSETNEIVLRYLKIRIQI